MKQNLKKKRIGFESGQAFEEKQRQRRVDSREVLVVDIFPNRLESGARDFCQGRVVGCQTVWVDTEFLDLALPIPSGRRRFRLDNL